MVANAPIGLHFYTFESRRDDVAPSPSWGRSTSDQRRRSESSATGAPSELGVQPWTVFSGGRCNGPIPPAASPRSTPWPTARWTRWRPSSGMGAARRCTRRSHRAGQRARWLALPALHGRRLAIRSFVAWPPALLCVVRERDSMGLQASAPPQPLHIPFPISLWDIR